MTTTETYRPGIHMVHSTQSQTVLGVYAAMSVCVCGHESVGKSLGSARFAADFARVAHREHVRAQAALGDQLATAVRTDDSNVIDLFLHR